jgi:predicted SPOUT superfamily RNA methylase MTH1
VRLTPDIRCTVQLDPASYKKPGQLKGTVVSPSAPREDDGTYWGYTTRLASSIKAALDECPYEGGYDLKIGTSERGDSDMESKSFALPSYKHALIVFGGPNGIEECVDADETLKLPGAQSKKLFDLW